MSTVTTPPDAPRQVDSRVFVLQIGVTIAVVAVAVLLSGRFFEASLDARRLERAAIRATEAAERGAVFVPWTGEDLPVMNPSSDLWAQAPAMELPLQAQRVAMPMLDDVTVGSVRIQGLTDGEAIAWRLSWPDPSQDMNVDAGRFCDAVALQFPMNWQAHFTMGKEGEQVHILHWKGLWQKDVDEHFQDVQDLHPNYWTDLYWFAEGSAPFRVPEAFSDPRSHEWFAAYAAGNPLADFERSVPVEELSAEGYGTLTSQPHAVTIGRGEWHEGRWSVVFARPLRTTDPNDAPIWAGGRGHVAVAVWDGSAGNVGGRKHWTNWVEFEVSP